MDTEEAKYLLKSINNAKELTDALSYATQQATRIDNEAQQVFDKQVKAHRFIEVLNQMKKTIKDFKEEPEIIVIEEKELN